MLNFTWTFDGDLTDAVSLKFNDPTGAYGLRRSDTGEILIAAGTDWDHVSTGTYEYDEAYLDLASDAAYDYWEDAFFDGEHTRTQRFINGDIGALTSKAIRFVVIKDLEYLALDTLPVFSSPTGEYGVARVDTNVMIAAAGSSFALLGETLYGASFGEPEVGLTYRYYVKAIVGDATYYIPRTTELATSAMLVLSRYTNSTIIERMYGVDNLHLWLSIDRGDQAVDYAMRAAQFIDEAETQIDAGLGRSYFDGDGLEGDFSDGVPKMITMLATMLAGVLMYEAAGITQYDSTTNQVQHRLRWQRKKVEDTLKQLRNGVLRITGGISQPNYPTMGASCGIEKLVDVNLADPFRFFQS